MANKGKAGTGGSGAAMDALDCTEPELQQLTGLVLVLRLIGEAEDHIEPLAISAIARSAQRSLGELKQGWNRAISTLREQ